MCLFEKLGSFSLCTQFTDYKVTSSQMRITLGILGNSVKISKEVTLTLLHIHTATLLPEADASALKLFLSEKNLQIFFESVNFFQ